MNGVLKKFISYGLFIMALSATIHVDLHHELYDGYTICNIDCDDEKHHFITHQCEKCQNKNSSLTKREKKALLIETNRSALLFSKVHFKNSFLHFSLYSRPPPEVSVS